mmetsp:Transcript_16162/g.37116  ORF Transcript_16162/g.37116 Transcript_16162/m.37116 type:complete len:134 (-) Transcript_16162:190-591(-)
MWRVVLSGSSLPLGGWQRIAPPLVTKTTQFQWSRRKSLWTAKNMVKVVVFLSLPHSCLQPRFGQAFPISHFIWFPLVSIPDFYASQQEMNVVTKVLSRTTQHPARSTWARRFCVAPHKHNRIEAYRKTLSSLS